MKSLILARYIWKEFPGLIIISSLVLIITSLVETVALFFIAPMVDILVSSELDNSSVISKNIGLFLKSIGLPITLWVLFTIYIGLNLIRSGFHTCAYYFLLKIKYAVELDLTIKTFDDFYQAGWAFFRNNHQGILINTFIREIRVVGDAFAGLVRSSAAMLQVIIILCVPFYISWQVMSITMVAAVLLAIPLLLFGELGHRFGKKNTSTANKLSISLQESFSMAKVILSFSNQLKSSKIIKNKYKNHIVATLKSQTFNMAIINSYSSLGLLSIMAMLFAANKFNLPLSETSILIVAFIKIVPLIGQITSQKNFMDSSFPSYEQIMKLRELALESEVKTGTKIFTGFNNQIKIENFSFSYNNSKNELNNINIIIPKRNMIAIVGESGAGKTTLIDSLLGFNQPLLGKISIDGKSLKDYDLSSFRKKIGYVPQESNLFNMSIKDNLIWAKVDATDDEIKNIFKLANAYDFIERFPDKYDTIVGDRGVRLSGGQLQRIALARAMLRKPDLLILDEATSSLDTKSEKKIQKAIEKIAKETTLIVIAHRLSTLSAANYVYVLEDGCIIEEGTYSDLIVNKGQFYNMVESQKFSTV